MNSALCLLTMFGNFIYTPKLQPLNPIPIPALSCLHTENFTGFQYPNTLSSEGMQVISLSTDFKVRLPQR